MKGNADVIATLNRLLEYEMTAADQYFLHSRVYHDMGLNALYERIAHEREEELEHASRLVERILFLEGTPDLGKRSTMQLSREVPQMLRHDLDMELTVVRELRAAIKQCEQAEDYQTRHILRELLTDTEEDHTHWLEQQLRLIDAVGLPNYLQSQMGGSSAS